MAPIRNVLFIMTDQMRADCLSSAGHPVVRTPHLDWLAHRGVRFDRAYVQTPVCGPSRACFLTGRYTHAHRSYWNGVPLPADEATLPRYARAAGMRPALAGKLHHVVDEEFLARVLPAPDDPRRRDFDLAGYEQWELLDNVGDGWLDHLKSRGYDLPYHEPRVAPFMVRTPDGQLMNGWSTQAWAHPTVVREEDSDTAYLTRRAVEFIADAGETPWLLHLSYVKPHWPNVAPAPYHAMYSPDSVPPPVRSREELTHPHPLLPPFRAERRSLPFDDEATWRQFRATYYGLVSHIDDQLGRLFRTLEEHGRLADTLIIFTSDHGEYMGDHWLFEKELFYEPAARVPMIVSDPSAAADGTRGTVDSRFVESVDVLPTILDAVGHELPSPVQGRSLVPLLHGADVPWRDAVYGDWDFRFYHAGEELGLPLDRCRAWMVRDNDFKYVHFNGLPPMLFDLRKDPDELTNVANDPAYGSVVADRMRALLEWRQSTEDASRDPGRRIGVRIPGDGRPDYLEAAP